MAGYLGQSQPVAAGGNSVETDDIIDGAVTAAKLAPGAAVPSQSTHNGKFLTTDGADASWATVDLSTKLNTSGGTLTGNLSLGDSVKATFGASNDLQIFHDGSNTYINEGGTGDLLLSSGNAFKVRSADGVATGAVFNAYGSVDLYHNNAKKLATTSTGIDVTGSVTCDGSTFRGSLGNISFHSNGVIQAFSRPSISYIKATDALGGLEFQTGNNTSQTRLASDGTFTHSSGGSERMRIDSSGRVGIGETSPLGKLTVNSQSISTNIIRLEATTATSRTWGLGMVDSGNSSFVIRDNLAGNRFVISTTGNVGIGVTPQDKLQVDGSILCRGNGPAGTLHGIRLLTGDSSENGGEIHVLNHNGEVAGLIDLVDGADPGDGYGVLRFLNLKGNVHIGTTSSYPVTFETGGSERMRIDSGGNVGIGTSSPEAILHVKKDSTANTYIRHDNMNGGSGANAGLRLRTANGNWDLIAKRSENALAIDSPSSGEIARFTTTGVGIGTDSPARPLHVSTSTGEALRLEQTSAGTPANYLSFYDTGGRVGYVGYPGSGSDDLKIVNESTTGDFAITVNGSERMRITNTGSIGTGDWSGEFHQIRNVNNWHYASSSSLGGEYIHMKTNRTPSNEAQMYSVTFRGHSYSDAKPINTSLCWYNYSTSGNVVQVGSNGTHTASCYKSSDGYAVMTLYIPSHYYVAFTFDQFITNQRLTELTITNVTTSDSSTGAY